MKSLNCPNCSKNMGLISVAKLIFFHRSACSNCHVTIRIKQKGKGIVFFHIITSFVTVLFSPIFLNHILIFSIFLIFFLAGSFYDFHKSEIILIN